MTSSLSILVVDDEPQMRRFLRPALESEGYRVIEAATAREAASAAATPATEQVTP
jgi:two-component system KDP operon response regulator KdpE